MKTLSLPVGLVMLAFFTFPSLLFADITEQEIVELLGTDFHSEAAQSFIQKLDPNAVFPEHTEFSYNFYEQGVSLRITDKKWIQGIRIYNKTMLFKAAKGALPYTIDFAKGTSFSAAAQAIGQKPIVKDNTRGQLLIFPNKLPDVDYLIELNANSGNGIMSVAWILPENKMEEIVVANTPQIKGLESHDVVQAFFCSKTGTDAYKKILEHPDLLVEEEESSHYFVRDNIGMLFETSRVDYDDPTRVHVVDELTFFRRKIRGSQSSFSAALPTGLYWWSSPDDFLAQGFEVSQNIEAIGNFTLTKAIEGGTLDIVFEKNLLRKVHYKMTKKK